MSLITLFTAPKPFDDPHIALIQENALRSWKALGPDVEVLVLGEEAGLAEAAERIGVRHLPAVSRNAAGTPLISSMFRLARENSASPLCCIVNADILLLPDLIAAARALRDRHPRFVAAGQRWDLEVLEPLAFDQGWDAALRERAHTRGSLHRASGSDYFLFPRECFTDLPDFAIGRAGWDNWMIYSGRARGWPVVDLSGAVEIIHQNHDYRHLAGGKPHYRHPESDENVRLGGGRRTILELSDADYRFSGGQTRRKPLTWRRFWREVELFPLIRLHAYPLAQAAYFLFHPQKAYRDFRAGRF